MVTSQVGRSGEDGGRLKLQPKEDAAQAMNIRETERLNKKLEFLDQLRRIEMKKRFSEQLHLKQRQEHLNLLGTHHTLKSYLSRADIAAFRSQDADSNFAKRTCLYKNLISSNVSLFRSVHNLQTDSSAIGNARPHKRASINVFTKNKAYSESGGAMVQSLKSFYHSKGPDLLDSLLSESTENALTDNGTISVYVTKRKNSVNSQEGEKVPSDGSLWSGSLKQSLPSLTHQRLLIHSNLSGDSHHPLPSLTRMDKYIPGILEQVEERLSGSSKSRLPQPAHSEDPLPSIHKFQKIQNSSHYSSSSAVHKSYIAAFPSSVEESKSGKTALPRLRNNYFANKFSCHDSVAERELVGSARTKHDRAVKERRQQDLISRIQTSQIDLRERQEAYLNRIENLSVKTEDKKKVTNLGDLLKSLNTQTTSKSRPPQEVSS